MNQSNNLPGAAIVIATKNYAEWLPGAIESAVAQDYPNKIVYVIDDNSEDNTVEVMGNYVAKASDPWCLPTLKDLCKYTSWHTMNGTEILFFSLKENKGPSFVRNLAIENAIEINKCHIIAILDGDDKLMPYKISKCVSQILSDPQVIGGVYGDYAIYNVQTGQMTYESKWCYDLLKLKRESIVHSGAVYSSLALQFVKENFGFYYHPQLTTAEDWALNKMISNRFLFIHIPEILTLVRAHGNSSTQYRSQEEWNRNWQFVANL